MKTIGLVGGMTPESTRCYYEALIKGARSPGGDPLENPVIIIYSLNLTEVVQIQDTGDRAGVIEYLVEVLDRLEAAGAEVAALTANTAHAYLDEIRTRTTLPLVSMVTATRDAASKRGIECALLLGTSTTVTARMYPHEFSEAGMQIVLPDPAEQDFLDQTIYNDLAVGHVTAEVKRRYHEICTRHIEESGIDAVILGCTELPLVISPDEFEATVLDTTTLHVGAILAAAGPR